MPIVYGADIRQDDMDIAKIPVINVVGRPQFTVGQPTTGAGCYAIPWFDAGPQINPKPLPTYWLARPREATAAPLSPFPVVDVASPPGWNGVSISQSNTPFVYGVSGPPVPPMQGQAHLTQSERTAQQALDVINDLANGDWDSALLKVGVNSDQSGTYRALPNAEEVVPFGTDKLIVLLSSPHKPTDICSRFGARLAYILSGFNSSFEAGPNIQTVSGTPVIDYKSKVQISDVVSLRDAAVLLGLIMSGIDPSLYNSAMQSQIINGVADKALYDSLIKRDLAKEGITVGRLPNGAYAATVGLDLGNILGTASNIASSFSGIGGAVGDIASAVSAAANPIANLVSSVSSGNVNDIAKAATNALPAIGVAASALGEDKVAAAANKVSQTATSTISKVKGAVDLVKDLAQSTNVAPSQLASAVQNAAQQIVREERPVTQQLVESITDEDAGVLLSQVASLGRGKQQTPQYTKAYDVSTVNTVIDALEYMSNSPDQLIMYLEQATGKRIASTDALRSLYRILKERIGEVRDSKYFQPTYFQDEQKIIKAIKIKLLKLKNRKSTRALFEYLINHIERYYYV